jgi:uncharacterized membrane protein YphA (DoxX/SURF4 family)
MGGDPDVDKRAAFDETLRNSLAGNGFPSRNTPIGARNVTDILFLVGRLLFGGLFLYNGINHFTNFATLRGYCAYKGVPMPDVVTVLSGVWLTVSGVSVMAGFRPEVGLVMIALFLLGVTPKMHDFWKATDPQARMGDFVNFQKNFALLGAALALLLVPRPWPMSLG